MSEDNLCRRKNNSVKKKKKNEAEDEDKKFKNFFHLQTFEKFSLLKCYKTYGFENFVRLLHTPTCPYSLGVVRALFGLMMIIDIPDERGLANIDSKFGDPMRCHFPLFNWLSPFPLQYMGLLYGIMWLGAFGICFGYKFHMSCLMFTFPYWYIYLLDKSAWNNHSYLYGLIAILLTFSSSNHYFSLDALSSPAIKNKPVPLWNYIIIRFQFFILYFYAGIKKLDFDWIGGYSMTRLSLHWVFHPFRLLLSNEQIDFWIIHIFGFAFDLTVGFFFLIEKTRPIAIIFSIAFHLMNSCLFFIGQFPYVCLVTTPIFCNYNWPEELFKYLAERWNMKSLKFKKESLKIEMVKNSFKEVKINWRHRMTCFLLFMYVGVQLFLPFSHFITQGYNNWTDGLYGYSWDMMVQNWSSESTVVKIIDNQSKEEFFLDPEAWVGNTRHTKHGDMLIQYAKCLKRNLLNQRNKFRNEHYRSTFDNISVYIDVWCSLNGRFQQRMFDPKQDLLKAEWSPFKKIDWLMPLLSDLSPWRKNIDSIQKQVFEWSNHSDVLFIADFPGLYLEYYIGLDFTNVSITVLEGIIILEQRNYIKSIKPFNTTLVKGDTSKITEGLFHKVYTVSNKPSCYMYTFNNHSMEKLKIVRNGNPDFSISVIYNTIYKQINMRINNFIRSVLLLRACLNKIIFNTPIPLKNNEVY